MSNFTRLGTLLIIVSVVVGVIFLSLRDDAGKGDAASHSGNENAGGGELAAGAPAPEEEDRPERPTAPDAFDEEQSAQKEHDENCSHCAEMEKTGNEVDPQLLTNSDADPFFKKLARMEPKVIPADTFEFLRGSAKGEEANFEIGEIEFRGTVSMARENHPMARSYGIELEDDLGRISIRTDANGSLVANIFFMEDSRVILAKEAMVEDQGEVLSLKESTIGSVICAKPDTILTDSGFRALSRSGNAMPYTGEEHAAPAFAKPSSLDIPALESRPGAEHVIYLDFDGETVTDTPWNDLSDNETIDALPLERAAEDEWVRLVWRRVVEDFAPFNINVTTDVDVFDDPDQDATKRLHVVITSTDDAMPGAGGVAFLYSYREDTPVVWVYNSSEYTSATTISHEAGHAFGLSHDGLGVEGNSGYQEYYPGHNGSYEPGWAPIMGAGFLDLPYDEVDQWSIGDYTDASNEEDDLAIIGDDVDPQDGVDPDFGNVDQASNGFGFVADDYADTYEDDNLGTFSIVAENSIESSGLISSTGDADVFEFTAPLGQIRFVVSPLDVNSIYSELGSDTAGANLAVDLELLDSAGEVIAEGAPTGDNLLSSIIETSVLQGTYYIRVSGGGRGTGPDTGFSDYGSLGEYTISGDLALPPLAVYGGSKQTSAIFNGTTRADSGKGTDYGLTTPGEPLTNSFFIENTGDIVEITDLEISLAKGSASQFQLGPVSSYASISPGTGQFFELTYAPDSTGSHSDTVVINYGAGEVQLFEFAVKGTATASLTVDNYEPNDNLDEAYSLNGNENVWLEDINGLAFFISDADDWYSFTVEEQDDLIRIDTALASDGGNVRTSLLHFNGATFETLTSTTGDNLQYLIPENFTGAQRDFYIHVTTLDDASIRNAYDLRWSSIELIGGDDDLYEVNNSREEAFDLTGREARLSQILGLGVSNDEDWYKIDVERSPFTRMLYVAALFEHAEGDIDIQVYRESTLVGASETGDDKELVVFHETIDFDTFPEPFTYTPGGNFIVMGVEPASYYVRVYGDFAGNNYDLIVETLSDDKYEFVDGEEIENDTIENAYPLGESIIGQWLSDIDGVGTSADYPDSATETNFINNADADWYSFDIEGSDPIEQLTIDFDSFDGGTAEFTLYDESGESVAVTEDDSEPGLYTVNSPSGRSFFLRVIASNSTSVLSGYDFRIDFTSEPPLIQDPEEDNYEENDTGDQLYNISAYEGRYLSSIDGYGTQLDADWYEINIPSNASKLEATLFFFNSEGDLDLLLTQKGGMPLFDSSNGTTTERIEWDNPASGAHALQVTGDNRGDFYNLIWEITFAEDNYEENDTLDTASEHLIGFEDRLLSKLDGMAIQADEDWYRISASEDTVELRASITFSHNEGDIDLALRNSEGSVVKRSISTTDNEAISYADPVPGDYYLQVYYQNQGNEYDLTWSALTQEELDQIPEDDDNYEDNNNLNQAYVLEDTDRRLSETQGLGIQKDEDWYEIRIPENNVGLSVDASFTDALGDIDLEVYDPLGFPLAISESLTDNESVVLDSALPAGTYSIRVYGPDAGNEYDLFWTPFIEDIYEENDTYAEAYDISLLLGSPLSEEGVPTQGDEDWYEFEVAATNRPFVSVELEYENIDGAINFELLDSSRTVIDRADSTDDFESVLAEVTQGTYYVRVYGENRYNPYDLTVSVIGDDQYEENDVYSVDVPDLTSLPDADPPRIQAVQFDDDWYQFTITESNSFISINASFKHANGNIDVFLYEEGDPSTPIGSGTSTDDNESFRVPGGVGTYFIQVTGDDTNQAYQLSWTNSPDDNYEENDTLDDAALIANNEGETIEGIQFDPDWYEISTEPGRLRLVVDLLFEHGSGDLNLSLYDSDGTELVVVDSDNDDEQIAYSLYPFGETAETYYIKVDGASAGTEYELVWQTSIEDNFEGDTGNNTFSTASDVLLDVEGRKISDTIGYGGALNDDWYKVQINPGEQGLVIEAFFQHSEENNIDLELFSAGESLLRRSAGFSDVERINYEGDPGTYYLRVFGTSSEKPYNLVWNSYAEDDLEVGFAIGAPDDPPDNDTPESPRELKYMKANRDARGDWDLEFIELDNLTQLDEDWYRIHVDEGDDIFIVDLEFDHRYGDIDTAVYQLVYENQPVDPEDPEGIQEEVLLEVNLIGQSESLTDSESITATDLPASTTFDFEPGALTYEYLVCVYGYGIYNPKLEEPGWEFDPYAEDYSTVEENEDSAENSYYRFDEEVARSLGNTYTMRWISTAEDEFDESNNDSPTEVNDSFDFAAEPPLIDQWENEDADDGVENGLLSDGKIDDEIRTHTYTNDQGEEIDVEYQATYTYEGLTQLDDDWYKFTVDTGGNHDFYVGITFNDFHANLDLHLYDESNNLLASSESGTSSFESIEQQGSGERTYYVKVVGEDLGTPYRMLVRGFFDDIYEENDEISQADENADITDLTSDSIYDTVISGLVQRDVDLYRVNIPSDQVHLNFYLTGFAEFPDIEVLDSEGNPLPSGYEVSGNTNRTRWWAEGVISPEAGTYYLEVTGSDSGASYSLGWNYDNEDEYEDFFNNDESNLAYELTRYRLEPVYNPDDGIYEPPIKEFGFDYDLLSNLYFSDGSLVDAFGHAIQESDDWYSIQIPSWFLATAKKGDDTITVLKREYHVRLFAEIEFEHLDGNIDMEIYDETDLDTPLARSATSEDIESFTVAVDPTEEARTYYIRVYGDDAENDYSLKWDVSAEDAYEQLEDASEANDTNNFVDQAYDLTTYDVTYGEQASTEGKWLHEVEYMQDVNGDGVANSSDGGLKSTAGYGIQQKDDWYTVVVSEGATQLQVEARFWSDNDTGYEYGPDDLDIDFEVYFLAGDDSDPGTHDLRKPVLIGRSIEDTDDSLFSSDGNEAKALEEDITTPIDETATFDVEESGIYFIRIYYDNRSHPYTFRWDDIGDADDADDSAIIEDYLNGNWSFVLPKQLPGEGLTAPYDNLDGDRYLNWEEFALGLDNSKADTVIIGKSIAEIDGQEHFQFEFLRNRDAEGLDYEFIVEESEDLIHWNTKAVHLRNEDVPENINLERAVYRSSKPMDELGQCFFRLIVKEPTESK